MTPFCSRVAFLERGSVASSIRISFVSEPRAKVARASQPLSLPTSFLSLHHVCFYGCKSRENTGNRQCSKLTGTAFVTRANHGSPRPLTARILCVFQAIAQ